MIHVPVTGSTNVDLLARGRGGDPAGVVLVADHQTAGRGRQARTFYDEPGAAVLMSVLLRPPVEVAPLVPFLMGLAAAEAVDDVAATGKRLALKWPNDVLVPELGERKLAGILAEATTVAGAGRSDLMVVVGMGLNLRWTAPPPAEVAERAATVEELVGVTIDRWILVRAVLARLDRWLQRAESGDRAGVLDVYRAWCCTLGRTITLETPGGLLEGVAHDVAPSGALVVLTDDGPVEVLAGEAHHRR